MHLSTDIFKPVTLRLARYKFKHHIIIYARFINVKTLKEDYYQVLGFQRIQYNKKWKICALFNSEDTGLESCIPAYVDGQLKELSPLLAERQLYFTKLILKIPE